MASDPLVHTSPGRAFRGRWSAQALQRIHRWAFAFGILAAFEGSALVLDLRRSPA